MSKINIEGLDKAELIAALCNQAILEKNKYIRKYNKSPPKHTLFNEEQQLLKLESLDYITTETIQKELSKLESKKKGLWK